MLRSLLVLAALTSCVTPETLVYLDKRITAIENSHVAYDEFHKTPEPTTDNLVACLMAGYKFPTDIRYPVKSVEVFWDPHYERWTCSVVYDGSGGYIPQVQENSEDDL